MSCGDDDVYGDRKGGCGNCGRKYCVSLKYILKLSVLMYQT